MNSLEVNIRDNKSKGQLNAIRANGNVPAIIYGGKDENQKCKKHRSFTDFGAYGGGYKKNFEFNICVRFI